MLDTIVSGLVQGNVYALMAVGISLIFGVTGVVNFAQGSIVGFGAMLGWWFMGSLGWPWWLSLLAVAGTSALIGWVINFTAVRPLIKAPPIAALLATFAASLVLDNVSQLLFGAETRPYPEPLPTKNIPVAGLQLDTADVVAFVFTILAMAALWAWLRFGKDGLAVRATAADPDAARQMGVSVAKVQNLSFLLASCLGGVGGIFFGMFSGALSPYSASLTGTVGFIAAAVGGLSSISGAVAGGFVIGMVQALGIYLTDDKFRNLFIFGAFLLVLLLRPHGLFGSRHAVVAEPMTGTFLGAGRPIRIPGWLWVLLAVAAGFVVPWLGGGAAGTQVVLYAIIAVPMTLLAGSTGQISLGQAAPVAIGAYASALLVMRLDVPFLLALLLGGVIAAVLATVVTLPIWKLDGHYVSMATLALGYIVVTIIGGWESLTQGALGISGIPAPEIFGLPLLVSDDHYQLGLVVLGLTLFVVIKLRSSHLGTVLAAVGSDEVASRSLGLKTRSYKALAYAIAAFFAGVAGSLTAHQFTYLDPTMFPVQMSVLALTIVVLGGLNSPFGAVLGSVALIGLPEALRIAPDVRIILYGVVVILIIRFRPQGLWTRRA